MITLSYVIALPAAIAYIAYSLYSADSEGAAMGVGFLTVIVLFGLVILAISSLAAIFRDSVYLREVHHHWRPQWWQYAAIPIVISILGWITSGFLVDASGALAIGMVVFIFSAWASSLIYIWNRHNIIGIP